LSRFNLRSISTAKSPALDNPDDMARSRTPAAAPPHQAQSDYSRPSNPRIRSTLELIEKVRDSRYKRRLGEYYSQRKLLPNEYKQLLKLIKDSEDVELRTYFDDKLRYEDLLSKHAEV
jgi:hypothetical protein